LTVPVTELEVFTDSAGTGRATAAVTRSRFLALTAAMDPALNTSIDGGVPGVAHAAAGAKAIGVSMGDQPTVGGMVAFEGNPGKVVPVEAGAAVTAGAEVQSDATGRAIPLAAGRANGTAWTAAGAAGTIIFVQIQ
jgi:hypothetical protein